MNAHDNILRHIDIIGGRCTGDMAEIEIITVNDAARADDTARRVGENGANTATFRQY